MLSRCLSRTASYQRKFFVSSFSSLREQWERDGFLVMPNVVSQPDIRALREETAKVCRGERGKVMGLKELDKSLSSDEVVRQYLAIHFPHKLSPLMKSMVSYPSLVSTLREIIGANVKCMQSMLFIKHSGKPGQAWHQDEYYIPTRDRSLVGAWIAMDDATIQNGCMWMIPGSHKHGVLWETRAHSSDEFDEGTETYNTPYDTDTSVQGGKPNSIPCEVKAGGVVFFHGHILHRSLKNRSQSSFRRALVMHYCSAESMLPWDWDGRITPVPKDMRDIIMVCGTDPYAYRGVHNYTFPLLRGESQEQRDPTKKIFLSEFRHMFV